MELSPPLEATSCSVIPERFIHLKDLEVHILSILCNRADYIQDLGVFLISKFNFRNHANYIFSRCIQLLGLVSRATFSF
jgi:hypothetical protein